MTEINPNLTGRRAEAALMWAASDWGDVAAFIGPNAARFQPLWAKLREQAMQKGAGFATGWCWPAFLTGFAWYLYRRMWVAGAILLAVPLAIAFLLPVSGGSIGIAMALALLSRTAYIQHAVSRIAKIRASGGGEREIAAAGGVSVAGGVVGGVIIAFFLGAFILALALGVPNDELRN